MRVLTILLRFGIERYVRAESDIEGIFRRQMPLVDRTTIIVDNALPASYVEQNGRRATIGGDNSASEFSGFYRALQFVGADIWRYDLIHFATSAFNMLYVDYLQRFNTALLDAVMRRPVCLGHIDCYDDPVEILNISAQHWIRSCFFLMSPNEVQALGDFATIRDGRPFFSGVPGSPFRSDAPLSENYRNYIRNWLNGKDIGQGVTWHSSFELTRDTLREFERKALAIMNEQLLSARLRGMGCLLTDVTWLATRLEADSESVNWDTDWREQLVNRRRAAVGQSPAVTSPGRFLSRIFPFGEQRVRQALSSIVSRRTR